MEIKLNLSDDTPNSINFEDTYDGLDNPWYSIEIDNHGSVTLSANQDGFEHLGRYFLKLARSNKTKGFHSHHPLEFGKDNYGSPEFTVGVCNAPDENET